MNRKLEWLPVSHERPCPICEKPDNCSVSRDGGAVWCGRVEQGSIRQNSGGQWLHRLRERGDSPAWQQRNDHRSRSTTVPIWPTEPKPPSKDWGRIAKEAFGDTEAKSARYSLATELGVSVDALCRLGVGWMPSQRCWAFPERDAAGTIIGINRRFADGKKQRVAGSRCGLTFDPEGWLESAIEPGFVLLVEGGSDAAAASCPTIIVDCSTATSVSGCTCRQHCAAAAGCGRH